MFPPKKGGGCNVNVTRSCCSAAVQDSVLILLLWLHRVLPKLGCRIFAHLLPPSADTSVPATAWYVSLIRLQHCTCMW